MAPTVAGERASQPRTLPSFHTRVTLETEARKEGLWGLDTPGLTHPNLQSPSALPSPVSKEDQRVRR